MYRALLVVCLAVSALAEENPERFYSAIRANDLTGLKAMLDQGASPNTPDARQITPLMVAAEVGSLDAMKMLIARGADVNAQNTSGSTALMWSVSDAKKVRLLLDHGADVNKTAKSGRTALIIAAYTNQSADVVRMLLGKGANVNAMDARKVTPIYGATFAGDTATIKLLLDAGADPNVADTFVGLTPLMNIAGNRNAAAVKMLLAKGAKVNAVSMVDHLPQVRAGTVAFGGFTPLLMAAPYGPPETVKALLDAGADVNVQDLRGFTSLMLAVGTDRLNPETVNLLLEHHADRGAKNLDGETALDWAHKLGVTAVIQTLGGAPKEPVRTVAARADSPDIRTAVTRSVVLLEKTNTQFFTKTGCFGCHEQLPAEAAAAAARAKGIAVNESAAKERRLQITSGIGATQMEGAGGLGGADNNLYEVEALLRSGYAPDRITDYLAANLAAYQGADGGWHLPGYSRSPIQDSDFSRTALAMRALKAYGSPGRAAEMKERLERGKQWLLRTTPVITEDWNMRLVGVAAAGADAAKLKSLAEPILARQRADGGWTQREPFASDAYATGMTLWSLAEAGVILPGNDAYQKGVKFLLSTQSADGSWHVVSRATKFQPYFESGFPYGPDQWISTMATGWAANALALAIDARATAQVARLSGR
jgi:ankyrin repeat protein